LRAFCNRIIIPTIGQYLYQNFLLTNRGSTSISISKKCYKTESQIQNNHLCDNRPPHLRQSSPQALHQKTLSKHHTLHNNNLRALPTKSYPGPANPNLSQLKRRLKMKQWTITHLRTNRLPAPARINGVANREMKKRLRKIQRRRLPRCESSLQTYPFRKDLKRGM
jgi:hypothetical protein